MPTPQVVNNVVLYNALFDVPNPKRELMTQMTAQVFFVLAAAKDAVAGADLGPAACVASEGRRGKSRAEERTNVRLPIRAARSPAGSRRSCSEVTARSNGARSSRRDESRVCADPRRTRAGERVVIGAAQPTGRVRPLAAAAIQDAAHMKRDFMTPRSRATSSR